MHNKDQVNGCLSYLPSLALDVVSQVSKVVFSSVVLARRYSWTTVIRLALLAICF